MKKLIAVLFVLFSFSLLAGCQLIDDIKSSYNNLKNEATEVRKEIDEKKAEAAKTYKETKEALDAVNKAAEEVKKITE